MLENDQQRPKVTGVTINVLYPDGHSRTVTIDPTITEAIFWSDRAVNEILAPFYEVNKRPVTREWMTDALGDADLLGDADSANLSPEMVKELWKRQNKEGMLRAVLAKSYDCLPQ